MPATALQIARRGSCESWNPRRADLGGTVASASPCAAASAAARAALARAAVASAASAAACAVGVRQRSERPSGRGRRRVIRPYSFSFVSASVCRPFSVPR